MQGESMNESSIRMTQGDNPPSTSEIAQWIGKGAYQYWARVTQLIEQHYPGVFVPEWLFGGKKHGWSLRYKKNRPFCTLVPEKNRFAVLIIFGEAERAKVEDIRDRLSAQSRKEYDNATIYHDGKWVLLKIDTDTAVKDVERLLAVKRRPKNDDGA
jgi:hypothetical protein